MVLVTSASAAYSIPKAATAAIGIWIVNTKRPDVPRFSTDVVPSRSPVIIELVIQTVVAVVAPLIITSMSGTQGGTFDPLIWHWDTWVNTCIRAVCWSCALVIGIIASIGIPLIQRTGRWVWLLPSVFYLWALASEAAIGPRWDFRRALQNLLLPNPAGESLGVVFTYCTWNCISYSLGILIGSKAAALINKRTGGRDDGFHATGVHT